MISMASSIPLRWTGWAVAGVYVIGTWVYGILYIWEHWSGPWSYGNLATTAFVRAMIWPLWVILDLL